MSPATTDPRTAAFCSTVLPDLFHAVAHHQQIWRRDPYDVESIHAEARNGFERMLHRATTPPGPPAGRVLLLLGESGSGKTHLLHAIGQEFMTRRPTARVVSMSAEKFMVEFVRALR